MNSVEVNHKCSKMLEEVSVSSNESFEDEIGRPVSSDQL